MIDVSIIILNWNTAEYLEKCLDSIYSSAPQVRFEVIVVDNNSDDDISYVKKIFPNILLIKNAYNYGFAIGTNIGYRHSSGKFVMTLNPDTIIFPETIDKLVETLNGDDQVGMAVPVLHEQKVHPSQYSFFNLFVDSFALRLLRSLLSRPKNDWKAEPFDAEFIAGTGYICRASALGESFFHELNFLFGEEYYLCTQIRSKGYRIRIVPAARLKHYISVSFKHDPERAAMASSLGAAVGWRIRKDQWGSLLAVLSGSLLSLEFAFKWAVILLAKRTNTRDARIRKQCQAMLRAFPLMLLDGDNYLAEINAKAAQFFNSGRTPELPPVWKEVTGQPIQQR